MKLKLILTGGLILSATASGLCFEPVRSFRGYFDSMQSYADINPVQKVILSLVLSQAKAGSSKALLKKACVSNLPNKKGQVVNLPPDNRT